MRDLKNIKTLVLGSVFGALVLVGTSLTAMGQSTSEEYREWQRAQQRAQREYQQYLKTRRSGDYRDWQDAQRRAQQEYAEYQQSIRYGGNTRYNPNPWNNRNNRYRVYRNGSYYSTDARGAELLRTAVRNGYSQGYRQGQLDRQYRRRYNYSGQSMYRSGTYGYQSYVARNQYQYYFQQGFQRGYEDGFNSTFRYGVRSGNGFNILGGVLNTILNLVDDDN